MKAIQIVLFLFTLAQFGQSQTKLSVQECVQLAKQNSALIESSHINVKLNAINEKIANQRRLPNLNANSNVGINFGRTIDPTTNDFNTEAIFFNSFGIGSNVTVYNYGKLNKNIELAEIDSKISQTQVKQQEFDIALQVVNAYLSVLFAQDNIKIASQQSLDIERQIDQLNKLIKAGVRAPNEIYELSAQKALVDQNKVAAENNYDLTKLQLKQLMRYDGDFDIVRPDESLIQVKSNLDDIDVSEVIYQALQNYPDVYLQDLLVESAEKSIDIAKTDLYPSISVGANLGTNYSNRGIRFGESTIQRVDQTVFINDIPTTFGIDQEIPTIKDATYSEQLNDNLSYGAAMTLNIPIFNNYQVKGNIERSKLNAINQNILRDQTIDNVKIIVEQSYLEALTSRKRWDASKIRLEAQENVYANNEKRFNAGSISSFEWSNQKTQLESAQINELIDKYNYFLKKITLDYYMGNELNF